MQKAGERVNNAWWSPSPLPIRNQRRGGESAEREGDDRGGPLKEQTMRRAGGEVGGRLTCQNLSESEWRWGGQLINGSGGGVRGVR
ncbi:hypothetical protein J6590_071283 [Homalodisca vitripennis]|nr:hypothetical protein J6590_071283 [Homalodisca vitripennis]